MKPLQILIVAIAFFICHEAIGQSQTYEGFYLCTKPKKIALLVYKGKIHGFTKNRLTSMQKLEEYDFSGLNSDGRFNINAEYWLDRTGKVKKKNTSVTDTKTIFENGVCIALERNGWKYVRASNFREVFEMLEKDYSSVSDILHIGKEKFNWDEDKARVAIENHNFYIDANLHLENLRGGELSFADLVNRLITNN
jgi:hypothetical protein